MSRLFCLVSCFLLTVGSGTVYAFSAYAPQLTERLGLSVKTVSFIGMIGNFAMAISGPFAGVIIDTRGFLIPIVIGMITGTLGYLILLICYTNIIADVFLLGTALCLVGVGSNFAFGSAVKCAAINFPSMRGSATAITISGYGLSAFAMSIFVQIAHHLNSFKDIPESELMLRVLLVIPTVLQAIALPTVVKYQKTATPSSKSNSQILSTIPTTINNGDSEMPRGLKLMKNSLFKLYFAILGLLSGMGQSYIYTCGYMVKALLTTVVQKGSRLSTPEVVFDPELITATQSSQVAVLSLSNCCGRLVGGLVSDFFNYKLKIRRLNALFLAAGISAVANGITAHVTEAGSLWVATVLTGLFYGMSLGIFPGIISDEFGVDNLSSNWGTIALAPIPISTLLTVRVGRIFDSHSDSNGICIGGQCFNEAYILNIGLSGLVFILLAFALNTTQDKRIKEKSLVH